MGTARVPRYAGAAGAAINGRSNHAQPRGSSPPAIATDFFACPPSARRWRPARKSYQNSIMASLQNEHSFFIIDHTIAVSPVAAHN
jgi:hypothetical protein